MLLVTGATGHIGNVLVRQLLTLGNRVRALVLPGEDSSPLQGLDVEVMEGNVLDLEAVKRAMQGAQTVYHLAGMISILPGRNQILRQVNIQGTQNVLDAARYCDVARVVYTSSIHAIARAAHGITIDESLPFDPAHAISEYDRSKAEASLAVLQAARQGLDAVIACPTGVIGPYDYRLSEMGSLILSAMKSRLPFSIDGAYDFVDVRDVANGLTLVSQRGRSGESYILSGERISVRRLIETVCEITNRHVPILHLPIWLARFAAAFAPSFYRLTKMRPRVTPYALDTVSSNSVISHEKARRDLGYAPRPLRESIADTINWFMENTSLVSGSKVVAGIVNRAG
jgi:dihydroflavonol-4-reductase